MENRLTRITDAEGNYIQYTLNALGRIKGGRTIYQ
jgi:YD repeat-containing protein